MVYQCLSFWYCGNPNCTPVIWAWFIQPLEMVTIHHWKKPDRNILQPSYSCWSCGFVWKLKGQSLNPRVYHFFSYTLRLSFWGIHHSSDKAIWRLGHEDTFFDHLLKALEELVWLVWISSGGPITIPAPFRAWECIWMMAGKLFCKQRLRLFFAGFWSFLFKKSSGKLEDKPFG